MLFHVASVVLSATVVAPAAQPGSGSPAVWPVKWILDHCPEFRDGNGPVTVTRCRVTESGEIGSFQRDQYLYAFYCVEEKATEELLGSCDDPNSVQGRH